VIGSHHQPIRAAGYDEQAENVPRPTGTARDMPGLQEKDQYGDKMRGLRRTYTPAD